MLKVPDRLAPPTLTLPSTLRANVGVSRSRTRLTPGDSAIGRLVVLLAPFQSITGPLLVKRPLPSRTRLICSPALRKLSNSSPPFSRASARVPTADSQRRGLLPRSWLRIRPRLRPVVSIAMAPLPRRARPSASPTTSWLTWVLLPSLSSTVWLVWLCRARLPPICSPSPTSRVMAPRRLVSLPATARVVVVPFGKRMVRSSGPPQVLATMSSSLAAKLIPGNPVTLTLPPPRRA